VIAAFHCKCIDPWLTEKKNTCPLCKDVVGRPRDTGAARNEEAQRLIDEPDVVHGGIINNGKTFFLIVYSINVRFY
jgi:hypothetical protein